MRLIELNFADGDRVQPLLKATLKTEPLDHRLSEPDARGRRLLRMVFKDGEGQKALDAISAILEDDGDWRLVVIPVEASLPIRNVNRTVGTILGSDVSRNHGENGLPEDTIRLNFTNGSGIFIIGRNVAPPMP